jgi:hypothetical protein
MKRQIEMQSELNFDCIALQRIDDDDDEEEALDFDAIADNLQSQRDCEDDIERMISDNEEALKSTIESQRFYNS